MKKRKWDRKTKEITFSWISKIVKRFKLESATRQRGRPKKGG